MNVRNFSLVLAIVAMSVGSVSAQGDFFFSFTEGGANEGSEGVTYLDSQIGDTGSLVCLLGH